jgi:hypothetical protein
MDVNRSDEKSDDCGNPNVDQSLNYKNSIIGSLVNKTNVLDNFSFYVYFYSLHVSGAMCPSSGATCLSSGEITAFMRHLLYVTLFGWRSAMHTRRSSTQNDKYQVWHWYSYFSWWCAHSSPKHVESGNRHTKKNCAPSWFCLQDHTGMLGQHNTDSSVIVQFVSFPLDLQQCVRLHCVIGRL